MFKENEVHINNLLKGLITDFEGMPPKDSVQDCSNLDFFPDKTAKRPPYEYITDVSALASGYSVIGSYTKRFTDNSGTSKDVTIYVAYKSSSVIKIFIDWDYNPSTSYGNYHQGSAGWNNTMVELTEFHDTAVESWEYDGTGMVTLIIDNSTLEAFANDYFNGWVVAVADGNSTIWGTVMDSYTTLGKLYLKVALNSEAYNTGTYPKYGLRAVTIDLDGEVISTTKISGGQDWQQGQTPTITNDGDATYAARFGLEGGLSIDSGSWEDQAIYEDAESYTPEPAQRFRVKYHYNGGAPYLELLTPGQYEDMNSGSMQVQPEGDAPSGTISCASWQVSALVITDGGSDYDSAESISVTSDGAGTEATFTGNVGNSTNNIRLSRFPVNVFNAAALTSISEVQFIEVANAVKLYFGTNSRPYWIGFIQAREYFGNGYSAGATKLNPHWNGFWMAFDTPDILNKDAVYGYGMDDWVLASLGGYGYGFQHDVKRVLDNNFASWEKIDDNIPATAVPANHWSIDYSTLGANELGLLSKIRTVPNLVHADNGSPVFGSLESYRNDNWAVLFELDGYQCGFLRQYASNRGSFTDTGYALYLKVCLEIGLVFNTHFDRRLTGNKLFYFEDNLDKDYRFTENESEREACNPYHLSDGYGGSLDINEDDKFSRVSNQQAYVVALNDYPQGFKGHNSFDWAAPYWLTNWSANEESKTDFHDNPENEGLSLNSFLNNYYYKDVYVKAKKPIMVADAIVALHLSNDSVSTDPVNDRNGAFKLAISQIQQGGVIADSFFSDERTYQVSQNSQIITGAPTSNDRFLVFTETGLTHFGIADINQGTIQTIREFMEEGAYSSSNVVLARYGDQDAGVYWVGKNGIYRFLNDHPENIIEYRWLKDYIETITTQNKQNSLLFFLPRTKEIFVVLGTAIYVWNIKFEHWKKYSYTNVPTQGRQTLDGELTFMDSTGKVFKTLPYNTSDVYKDETANATFTAINFSLKKVYTHDTKLLPKIFDRVELVFGHSIATSGGEPLDTELQVSVGENGSTTNIFSAKGFNLPDYPFKKKLTSNARYRGNYYTLTINPLTADAGNIKTFELFEIRSIVKLIGKHLTGI